MKIENSYIEKISKFVDEKNYEKAYDIAVSLDISTLAYLIKSVTESSHDEQEAALHELKSELEWMIHQK